MTQRIAMWSGPRNISTAMMRSWENRPDCSVVDEPFYAAYLADSGLEHPCRAQIMLSLSTDYRKVVEELTTHPVVTPLQYQKHMTHHIPRGMNMEWCAGMKHCFLIRDPVQVIASYLHKVPSLDEDAIGIRRQAELFREIKNITGETPVVIDSNDVLDSPELILGGLCRQLEIKFKPDNMLHWPAGKRPSDGVWASHWYQNVEKSTGFGDKPSAAPDIPPEYRSLAAAMQTFYEEMAERRIRQ